MYTIIVLELGVIKDLYAGREYHLFFTIEGLQYELVMNIDDSGFYFWLPGFTGYERVPIQRQKYTVRVAPEGQNVSYAIAELWLDVRKGYVIQLQGIEIRAESTDA